MVRMAKLKDTRVDAFSSCYYGLWAVGCGLWQLARIFEVGTMSTTCPTSSRNTEKISVALVPIIMCKFVKCKAPPTSTLFGTGIRDTYL